MPIMELVAVYRFVLKELLGIITSLYVITILRIVVILDGVMIIITVALAFVQQLLGILLEIMRLICVQLVAVWLLMLITILGLGYA